MKTTEAVKAINKAYKAILSIDSAEDLKREKLTPSDYNAVFTLFSELTTPGSNADTLIKAAADFFARCGYTVKPAGIAYNISC